MASMLEAAQELRRKLEETRKKVEYRSGGISAGITSEGQIYLGITEHGSQPGKTTIITEFQAKAIIESLTGIVKEVVA